MAVQQINEGATYTVCWMLTIDIDLVVQSILHPHVVIGKGDITSHVSSNLNRYWLNGCVGSSTVVLEAQKTFGITALIFLDELAPCVWLFWWTMITWLFGDDYHHDKDHFWVCIDFFLQFLPQLFSVLGKNTFNKNGNFRDFGVCEGCKKEAEIGGCCKSVSRQLKWKIYFDYGVEHVLVIQEVVYCGTQMVP